MARVWGIAAILAVLLTAIAASAGAQSDESIVVTRDSGTLPSGCTPREAADLLVRLADAVTRGDAKAIDRLFAIEDPPGRHANERAEPFFRWYSVGSATLYDRAQLAPYFAERHRFNERWQLIAVDIGRSWIPGGAGIGYTLERTADDLPSAPARIVPGKGEIDCVAQRIYVWSMAEGSSTAPAQPRPTPCPTPSGWTPGKPIVACSRTAKPDLGSGRTARAMLPDVRLDSGAGELPRLCGPAIAFRKVRSALSAFNTGLGIVFAKHFARVGTFHPYTKTVPRPLRGAAIAVYAQSRYSKRDGWTGAVLHGSRKAQRRTGVYRLDILLSSPGRPLASLNATVVFDCRSGRIQRWVGPDAAAP